MRRRHHPELAPALQNLSRANATRRWIERMVEAGGPTSEEVVGLCKIAQDASGKRWKERAAACWYLRYASMADRPAAVEALINKCTVARIGYAGTFRRALAAAWCGGAAAAWAIRSFAETATLKEWFGMAAVLSAVMFGPALVLAGMQEGWREQWARAQAVGSLGVLAPPECAAVVAARVFDDSPVVRQAATGAVVPILRGLTAAYCGAPEQALECIVRLLDVDDKRVLLAAIGALERMGGGSAVEPMERLAVRSRFPGCRRAAKQALPVLRERQRQEREAARLLRPTSAPEDSGTLLRPAASAGPDDDALLLRAVEGEPE